MAAIATRRAGNNTFAPSDGSRTLIMHDAQPVTNPTGDPSAGDDDVGPGSSTTSNVGSIHLRGGPRVSRRRVAWTDETVDNEGMGKKKSKICCIYHKPRRFDESSSEEDSDDDSDSDDDGRARPSNLNSARRHNHHHHHHHSNGDGEAMHDSNGGSIVHEVQSSDEDVNAYERQPKRGKGKGKA